MVMKGLKMLIAAVGLIALAAVLFYQQTRIDRFAAQAVMLREQLQQAESAQNQAEAQVRPQPIQDKRPDSVPSLTEGQFSELLRLRGQVGILRAQLAEAAQRANDNAMPQRDATSVAETDGNKTPILSDLPLVGRLFTTQSNSVDGLGFSSPRDQIKDKK
jgi:hypothetical protein